MISTIIAVIIMMIIVDYNGIMLKVGNIGDDCDYFSEYMGADHKNDYLKKSC